MTETELKNQLNAASDLIKKGDFDRALEELTIIAQKNPNNNETISKIKEINECKNVEDKILRYKDRKNFKMACEHLKKLTSKVDNCSRLEILKCECLIYNDNLKEAQDSYSKLKNQPNPDPRLKWVEVLLEFYTGNLDTAINICDEMQDDDNFYKLLVDFQDLKKYLELGDKHEKANEAKLAQVNFTSAYELCELKPMGLCLNKLLAIKLLVKRGKVNSLLQSHIDALADTHRSIHLLRSLTSSEAIIDKKLMSSLWIRAYINLAFENARLPIHVLPTEFDLALDHCENYEDLKKDILASVVLYEQTFNYFYVGNKHSKMYETINPQESTMTRCLEELKSENSIEDILLEMTKLPRGSDTQENNRVKNYIVSRCSPAKFKNNKQQLATATDIVKLFNLKNKDNETQQKSSNEKQNESKENLSLSDLLEKFKEMTLTQRAVYFDIKPLNAKDDKPEWYQRRLRIVAGKKFHPGSRSRPNPRYKLMFGNVKLVFEIDQYSTAEDKAIAGKIYELLQSDK